MDEHYYSEHPQSKSERHRIQASLRGSAFTFTTDAGVFSKTGIDFGTRLLIETFREPAVSGPVLDMGCGYGPIGISVSRLMADREVVMVDINDRATALARENVRINEVRARVLQSYLFEKVEGSYAAILSNPPIRAGKKVVHQIFSESHDFLLRGGEFWTVIQKKQGAPSALAALQSLFDQVEIVARKKGYYIFCAKKV
ncbi:MAG: class I SAM-dependent methyltransferase [Sporolactobacillus sp.]